MSHLCHTIEKTNAADGTVRLLQLTDTHLGEVNGATLLGMDTDHSLQVIIELAQKERDGTDVVLGTGDLSDCGARTAYQRLQGYFSQFPCASFWLPGNHDDRAQMQAVASTPERLCKEIRAPRWQILLLDSQVPGQVGGELGRAELQFLEASLAAAEANNLYTLVCLHHQPIEIGCHWLDEQMVVDASEFFDVLDRHSCVRGVLWGHVHQEIDQMRGPVRLMGSPSTCVQFAPNNRDFKADDLPPGYRWLDLHEDGQLETGVSRAWDVPFTVELDSGGYL